MKGSTITVRVRRVTSTISSGEVGSIECVVMDEYPKFLVLSTGKFRFCAFRDDLDRGEEIAI
jgi:hypothetical protein